MLSIINVAISAILGVILANSPIFAVQRMADMQRPVAWTLLLIFQAINISYAVDSILLQRVARTVAACLFFVLGEVAVFVATTWDPTLVSAPTEGLAFKFVPYLWLYLAMTCMWFGSNVGAALLRGDKVRP